MMKRRQGLLVAEIAVAALLTAGILLFLAYAPPMAGPDGESLGEAFRIFYFHVPAAWVSFLLFFVAFAASIGYLATGRYACDRAAAACAEVGWIYATIVITTGPIWARAAWGMYWSWEPRLTSFLVLWLMYLGYILLRASIDDPEKRARFASVLAIIAFIDVPIVFFSIKIWGEKGHPVPNIGFFRDPVIRNTLFFNVFAYLSAATLLAVKRARLERPR